MAETLNVVDENNDFDITHSKVARWEGGKSVTAIDKGNWNRIAGGGKMKSNTYYGLTFGAWYESLSDQEKEDFEIPSPSENGWSRTDFSKANRIFDTQFNGNKAAAKGKIKSIFKKRYWDGLNLGDIKDPKVAAIIYDAAVNQGYDIGTDQISFNRVLAKLGIDPAKQNIGSAESVKIINNAIDAKGADKVLNAYSEVRLQSYGSIAADDIDEKDPSKGTNRSNIKGWVNRLNDFSSPERQIDVDKVFASPSGIGTTTDGTITVGEGQQLDAGLPGYQEFLLNAQKQNDNNEQGDSTGNQINVDPNVNANPIGNQIVIDPSTGEVINQGGTGPGPGAGQTGSGAQDPTIPDDNIYSGGVLPEVKIEGERGIKIEQGQPPNVTDEIIKSIEEKETDDGFTIKADPDTNKVNDSFFIKPKEEYDGDPGFTINGTEPNQTDELIKSIENKVGEDIKVKEPEVDLTKPPAGPVAEQVPEDTEEEFTPRFNVPFNIDINDSVNSLLPRGQISTGSTETTGDDKINITEEFAKQRGEAVAGSTISGGFGFIGVNDNGVPQYGMTQKVTSPDGSSTEINYVTGEGEMPPMSEEQQKRYDEMKASELETQDLELQDPDEIEIIQNENKGEDGSNTKENFDNVPAVNPYFNINDLLYVAEAVTTAPVGSAAQQEALPD